MVCPLHYILSTWPMDLLYPWSTDLLYHGEPADPLIFYVSGLSSIPSLHYILSTWPMDLLYPCEPADDLLYPLYFSSITSSPPDQWILYPWSTYGPIDLLYQWSVLYPFSSFPRLMDPISMVTYRPIDLLYPVVNLYGPIDLLYQWSVLYPFSTLHPPYLTNGSSISMVNLRTHWSSVSVICPLPLLYITSSPPDQWPISKDLLLYQWSVLYPFSTLHPPHLTNGSSISMVNLRTHWSSISVVCPLPLLYITSSPPDQWIFYIHGQPTDPLIFYISGLSSIPSLHYILPTWPMDLLYYWNKVTASFEVMLFFNEKR